MHAQKLVPLFALIILIGCGGKENVDVVGGVRPISNALFNIHTWVKDMAGMPAAERQEYLRRAAPHLEESVPYFLRGVGKMSATDQVERVQFFFGTLENIDAEEFGGKKRHGYAKDQLVARVFIKDRKEPIDVLVQCLNGVFALTPGDVGKLQDLGTYPVAKRFTIGKGEGLINHVDFPVAMDLSERFHLQLFETKRIKAGNEISVEKARTLEDKTGEVQVTVLVYEGDTFDLGTMQFTPSPNRP